MKEKLLKKAKELKISDLGVVKARVFDDLCLDLRAEGVESSRAEKMSNPFLYMEDAKSVIVCIFSYNTHEKGNISKYAFGKDYHKVITKKLAELSEPIIDAGFKCKAYTDSWDLNERFLAVRAGLGFIGENRLFISPKFGSFVFIGVILTDCPLEESNPCEKKCLMCGKCVKACPANALSGGFKKERCVSDITQKKGILSEEEEGFIRKSGYIWGCDICQEVCPYNKNVPETDIEEFAEDRIVNLKIDENMPNREFRRKYADRAFSWRGINPLKRNQKIMEKR